MITQSIDPYLTVASILAGFGVTVLMFRIQRELYVREKHPESPIWLAWADYLVIAATLQSLLLVILPLIIFQGRIPEVEVVARGACASSVILIAVYPFAILDHYRIEWGKKREFPRRKGEPIEKVVVIGAAVIALGTFGEIIVGCW